MITLDYADKRPLYEQIKDKLRELIIIGALKPHDRIPSVRELAAGLSINPNTIQKAYRELEYEGYIYSKQAKGNYVSPPEDRKDSEAKRAQEIYSSIEDLIEELVLLGEKSSEIQKRICGMTERKENGNE